MEASAKVFELEAPERVFPEWLPLTVSASSEPAVHNMVSSHLPPADSVGNLRAHFVRAFSRLALLVGADVIAIMMGRELVRALRAGLLGNGLGGVVTGLLPQASVSGLQLSAAVVIGMLAAGAYRGGDYWRDPARVLAATGIGVLLALYGEFWLGSPLASVGRGLVIWATLGIALVLMRSLLRSLAHRLPASRLEHRVLEIQGGGGAQSSLDLGPSYQTVAILRASELPSDIEEMEDWLRGGVDTLVVSGQMRVADFGRLKDFALAHGCRLLCVPRAGDLGGVEPRRVWLGRRLFSEMTAPGLRASQLLIKRIADILGASILLVVLAPVLVLLALVVKLDSPGPALFRQRRAGYRGKFFGLMKFRSMRADAEQVLRNDPVLYARYLENDFKLPEDGDPRVTRLGRFLRRTSLDELPQLVNVLKGDMSFVGPRPVVEPELEMYRGRIPTFLSVKPGVTGPWQVSGRSKVAFPERAQLDLDYVRHWSLLRDLWIVIMTVPAVLLQRGAH